MAHTPLHQADRLLDALDPLPYPLRMSELAAKAREMDPAELRPLVAELDERGPYERGVAVVAAAVGGDAEWVGARLADPDSFVRGQALRVATGLGVPDDAFVAALHDAPAAVRRQLLHAIVAARRSALADRVIDGIRETWGDVEAARLLPGCGAGTVARLLPALFHAVRGWTGLGTRHPGVLLDTAERELSALPEALRDGWWQRYADAVAAVTTADPLRVLDLLVRHGPAALPVRLRPSIPALTRADPARVVRMLLVPEGHAIRRGTSLRPAVLRHLARHAPQDLLVELGQVMAAHYDEYARLVKAHPPARRGAFHEAVLAERGSEAGTVNAELLDVLPRSYVAGEARRTADRAKERGAGWSSVLLAESYLPVAQAREQLVAATQRASAEDRAEAWPLLIRNAGRSGDPDAVTAVLHEMSRLCNEQDPVRSAAMHALAATPPALFTEDAEPHLDRVATDAVAARDSSPDTRQALSRLAIAVLREHAATGRRQLVNWALRTLVRISGSTGGADLGRLDRTLRRGQEHAVFEALRPWIEAGAEKADFSLAFALARAVGRRAAGMPELQDLLWQAVRFGDNSTAQTAVGLWLEPPGGRDQRVERLVNHEPSAAALPAVVRVLSTRRTDLLDRLLGDTPPYGRFLTRGTHWTVPVGVDVRRWTARQQRAAARQLERAAYDESLPLYARASALMSAARIPDVGADVARRWTGSQDVVLAEAAIAALAWTDRPAEVLSELLAHAGGDRARVAVYAATRASRYARPSLLGALLSGVLAPGTTKVTSRKEAVRLAATRLPLPEAAGVLADAYAVRDQHRDVRAACVAFSAPLLGDERTWQLLKEAAAGDTVLRTAVLRVLPMDLPEPDRPRYARLVREVCDTEDTELAALAYEAVARWVPWSPDASAVLVAAVTRLDARQSWHAAADGLASAAPSGPEAGRAVERALQALVTADTAAADEAYDAYDVDDAGTDRDRPARRRVEYLVTRLSRETVSRPGALRPVLTAAAELLARHDAFVPQAAALLVESLDLNAEPAELHAAFGRLVSLHEGRPALAVRTAGVLEKRIGGRQMPGDTGTLLAAARQLADAGGHTEGLLAVTVVSAAGSRTSWTEPWRVQLRKLRRHVDADVRDAALGRVTAYE
ncbi:hypothetical protein [Streptomyces sp. V1I1]|uniref:hypothetical protein n=1 Tax=Streptomyces sp. V1I1 TaxID=3042272 RepID=UPI002784A6B5|nr:hypothetical protein [Streptomyces sp. V1I1]MDQ0939469.1 hypothetical protein [Streptomyces sp. V1I1]